MIDFVSLSYLCNLEYYTHFGLNILPGHFDGCKNFSFKFAKMLELDPCFAFLGLMRKSVKIDLGMLVSSSIKSCVEWSRYIRKKQNFRQGYSALNIEKLSSFDTFGQKLGQRFYCIECMRDPF